MPAEPLQIQLLGAFEIRLGDRVIPADAWKLRKAAGIVKLLALAPDHRLHREQILDTLWPDLAPDAAANNLRYALHSARRILDADDFLRRAGDYVILGSPELVWVDVRAFDAAVESAWRDPNPLTLRVAIDLYTGDLLPEDRYEEWLDAHRTALRTSYLALLSRLARLREELHQPEAAIAAWKQLVAADPIQEESHSRLMLLYAQQGQRQEALRQYEQLVDILDREVGVAPEAVTRQLAEAIQAGKLGTSWSPPEPAQYQVNLPADTTSFIGREREVAEVGQLLGHARLVTLSGPGGVGKTRLALAVARKQLANFGDGVYAVMLAPLTEPGMVAQSIAQTLGVQEFPGQPIDAALASYLQRQSVLLILDNFEHLLPAATLVSTLLERCPKLSILVTSRVALRLRGEHEYPVQPLDLPDPTTADATTLLASSATQLFVQRSQESHPGFQTNHNRAHTIARICQRLDGLPLAIELAAARSRVLPPDALLERLARPLDVLTSGPRDLPDRQRTLRNTIAWSYDLLEPGVRALFRTLAVFPGGWTMEAVEAVCPAGVDPLDGLTVLIESSLVKQLVSDSDRPRFQMLETIREFGLEQLDVAGETDVARQRHAGYFLALAERLSPELFGPTSAARQMEISADHDNLRAALTYALDNDPDRALRVVAGLEKYWFTRGSFSEWLNWLEESLCRSKGSRPEDRGLGLYQVAFVCFQHLDFDRARVTAEEALELAWEYNVLELKSRATCVLSMIERETGDKRRAKVLAEEALGYFREMGDENIIAAQVTNIALIAVSEDDNERARELLEEALAVHRKCGDMAFVAIDLANLGETLRNLGRLREAAERLDEALELARSIGAAHITSGSLLFRALIAIGEGQIDLGRDLLVQSLPAVQAVGLPDFLLSALDVSAIMLALDGDIVPAAQIFAAAEAQYRILDLRRKPLDQRQHEHYCALCRSQMDAADWDHAWATGSALSMNEAITLAINAIT